MLIACIEQFHGMNVHVYHVFMIYITCAIKLLRVFYETLYRDLYETFTRGDDKEDRLECFGNTPRVGFTGVYRGGKRYTRGMIRCIGGYDPVVYLVMLAITR